MDYLEQKIRELEDELRHLREEVARKEAALAAYRDILNHLPARRSLRRKRTVSARSPRLSKTWRRIFLFIHAAYPNARSLSDIYEWTQEQADIVMKLDSLRTQLAQHANREYVERVKPGVFRVSAENLRKAGIEPPKRNEASLDVGAGRYILSSRGFDSLRLHRFSRSWIRE